MFNSDMKEASDRTVKIDDISAVTVEEMLHYIYTGQVDTQNPGDLLKAAHRYMLEELVDWCEKELCTKINTTNVVEYLILGVIYGAAKLRETAVALVVSKWKQIKETGDWNQATALHPAVIQEIFPEVMDKLSLNP